MAYTIIGSTTFASQANRDAARTRLDNALAAISYSNFASAVAAGVNNSGTTGITISISLGEVPGSEAGADMAAILDALTSSNRHTSGYVAVNKI